MTTAVTLTAWRYYLHANSDTLLYFDLSFRFGESTHQGPTELWRWLEMPIWHPYQFRSEIIAGNSDTSMSLMNVCVFKPVLGIYQILTSIDPHWESKNIHNGRRPLTNTGIQMKRKEFTKALNPLTNYSIWIFTHLKLCLADAIHNFKWVKIIQIWQNGGQVFSNHAGWCHILSLTFKMWYLKNANPNICGTGG